jgi:hypothetical protein
MMADPRTPKQTAPEKLLSLLDLREGWDGYQGRPISRQSVASALAFLVEARDRLNQAGVAMAEPFASPVSNGTVQLEWCVDGRDVEIEFTERRGVRAWGHADAGSIEHVLWAHGVGERP